MRQFLGACLGLVLAAGCFVRAGTGQEPSGPGKEPRVEPPASGTDGLPAARQNGVLRHYFAQLYIRDYNLQLSSDDFIQALIDSQIDRFLKDVEARLQETRADLESTRLLFKRWEETVEAGAKSQIQAVLRVALLKLADDCDGLSDRLKPVFFGLPRNGRKGPADEGAGPAAGMEKLALLIEEADRQVTDYLFRSTNLVRVDDLGDQNMIVRLEQAKEQAKRLSRQLR